MKNVLKKFSRTITLGTGWLRSSAIAFLLSLILFISAGIFLHSRDAIYLAVAGPTSEDNISGMEMVQGIQLYLDRLNAEGGVSGKKVKLLVFNDRNDSEVARQTATAIVKSTPALAVLGHLYSSTSAAGGEIYQQFGMPVITGSATADRITEDNDWYFRVIFNNRLQASFIANYVQKILGYQRASIIYSDDNYGETLRESFARTFTGLGGEIKHQWAIDVNATNFEQRQKQIVADLLGSKNDDPGTIFCATHNSDVVDLIVKIRQKELNYPLIGADSLGSAGFARLFREYAEERAMPGHFSNGIYAVSPIIFDVANEKAQQFRNRYIQKYGNEPGWTAATYYDAASMAVEAIKRAEVTAKKSNLTQERQQIKDALAKINTVEDGIQGVSGNLYFDRDGNLNESIYIGTFNQRKFISAFTQLQPVNDLSGVGNLKQKLDSGRILLIDGRYMNKTNIVYTGIDINEIRNLDEKNSSYLVDFYLWFRFRGDIDADNIEFSNYGTERLDSGDKLELDAPINEEVIDGITYRVYRVQADFKEKFRFDNYPFDRQKLAVRFRHANLTRDNLIYVVDVVGMRDTVAREIISNWEQSKVFETISDWDLEDVQFFQDILINDSTLGDPRLFDSDSDLKYSRFNAVVDIKRDRVSFAIKNLLPLLFFIGISYLLLFLPFDYISVEAVSGTLLAVVFFHLSLLEGLPEGIGYVVALDYGFYIIYGSIGLELLLVVVGHKTEIRENKIASQRLITIARIVFPTILLISAIAFFYRYGTINQFTLKTNQPVVAVNSEPPTSDLSVVEEDDRPGKVTLSFGSWRTDDEEQMSEILAAFEAKYPAIDLKFLPVQTELYNSVLENLLQTGKAPDLFYLRSFSFSQKLFDTKELEPLTDLPGVKNNYTSEALEPWTTEAGELYGVPVMAVSHGIYYNVDLFKQLDLEIPNTWAELIATAQTLKDNGYIPFANGSADSWAAAELMFMNLAPNYIGGRKGRLEYLNGSRCFNDRQVIAAFSAIAALRPFLPDNQKNVSYYDSQQLFVEGKAGMWMAGSWDIPFLRSAINNFDWSIFAVPPPAGQPAYVTFHPDFAVGLNASSPHKPEAKQFLQWLTTPEAARLFASELPGFFPLHKQMPDIGDRYAARFLNLNQGRNTDIRWAWSELQNGIPDGYSLMERGTVQVMGGIMTPTQAANNLQNGLAQWFEPAQKCQFAERNY